MAGEEVLELVDAAWCMHVFACGYPGDGRLVHLDLFGDTAQHHGFHGLLAVVEEGMLAPDDAVGDLEQGFMPALQALEKPACLLEVVAHVVVVPGIGRTLHHAGVKRVDA